MLFCPVKCTFKYEFFRSVNDTIKNIFCTKKDTDDMSAFRTFIWLSVAMVAFAEGPAEAQGIGAGFPGFFDTQMVNPAEQAVSFGDLTWDYGLSDGTNIGLNLLGTVALGPPAFGPGLKLRQKIFKKSEVESTITLYGGLGLHPTDPGGYTILTNNWQGPVTKSIGWLGGVSFWEMGKLDLPIPGSPMKINSFSMLMASAGMQFEMFRWLSTEILTLAPLVYRLESPIITSGHVFLPGPLGFRLLLRFALGQRWLLSLGVHTWPTGFVVTPLSSPVIPVIGLGWRF